jgi:cobalamin biosynthesis Co2+ chelatase CbiK
MQSDHEFTHESRDNYILRRMKEDREQVVIEPDEAILDKQIGGDHYKDCKIQPVEYIHANELDYFEGNVIKYVTRHRTKGEGKKDIEKAIHYAELILELYYK